MMTVYDLFLIEAVPFFLYLKTENFNGRTKLISGLPVTSGYKIMFTVDGADSEAEGIYTKIPEESYCTRFDLNKSKRVCLMQITTGSQLVL